MNKARIFANIFGQIGQECDHIMFCFALDLVDSVNLKGAFSQTMAAADAGITPNFACASQACASISNQIWNLLSSDQMALISGREYRGIITLIPFALNGGWLYH